MRSLLILPLLFLTSVLSAQISNPGLFYLANNDAVDSHESYLIGNSGSSGLSYRFQVDTTNQFNSPMLSDGIFGSRYGYGTRAYSFWSTLLCANEGV